MITRTLSVLILLAAVNGHAASPRAVESESKGKRVISMFLGDKKHGAETHYFEDGAVAIRLQFIDGIQQGKEIHFYPNGQRRAVIEFKDGQKHGDMFN